MKNYVKNEYDSCDRNLTVIGERLAKLRLQNGYKSYETFAEAHQISRMQYWRIEKGKTNLTMKSLIRILAIYNLTLKEFFGGIK